MRINGTEIAEKMYADLRGRVEKLAKKNVIPHLVVFLVGENPASVAYVTLKQRKGEEIGAKVTILRYDTSVTTEELVEKIKLLNDDPFVHAILVQRPLPEHIDVDAIEKVCNPEKDIDGFHPDSPYILPLPLAVGKILEEICLMEKGGDFKKWLHSKNIVLIGKGPTGGGPILVYFKTLDVTPTLIDSKTKDPEALMKKADIIVSAVGRENVVKAENIKKGAILISVGILRGENKKLKGDYDSTSVDPIAGYYTPTPGGVGPVNVAKLIENLLTAAEKQSHQLSA